MIQGNSLMPISSVYFPITRVYASLMADKIILCESGWDNAARGKANEIGIAQFLPQTWEWMSELSGLNGNIYNETDQLELLEWALESGYKNHWSCVKILGL